MNILAHGYLSGRNDDLLIGNFIGDFIKGDPDHPRHKLLASVSAGVRLHRAIDTFTDAHPDVAAVRELLRPRCHKYAGVAVDVFFDHFLAVGFEALTTEPLGDFIQYFYHTIRLRQNSLPVDAVRMADYMIRQDWLTNYQYLEGIDRSLNGLSRRTTYPSGLDSAIEDLVTYYKEIDAHFQHFWAELNEHIERVRTELLLLL